jgi:release factor glutamine methyltransferase
MTIKEPPGSPWTILSTLQWTTTYFKRFQIDSPRVDAEILLAHCLHCTRLDLYLHYDQPLNEEELYGFRGLIKRRVGQEPVAYIVGHKEFWSLEFEVNPSVLIPRPETEALVEIALENMPSADQNAGKRAAVHRILELGTGSGAVITALAHERPQHQYWASELSLEALAVARKNMARHVNADAVRLLVGSWMDPLSRTQARFDIILSNPPYIPTAAITELDPAIWRYEPRLALDGGTDGMDHLNHLIETAPIHLKPGGLLLVEIGYDQYDAVARQGYRVGAYDPISVRKDYAGLDRIACLRMKA